MNRTGPEIEPSTAAGQRKDGSEPDTNEVGEVPVGVPPKRWSTVSTERSSDLISDHGLPPSGRLVTSRRLRRSFASFLWPS